MTAKEKQRGSDQEDPSSNTHVQAFLKRPWLLAVTTLAWLGWMAFLVYIAVAD